MLPQELTHRMYKMKNDNDLWREVRNIAQSLTGFDALFVHCGYKTFVWSNITIGVHIIT
jgi:hypothetical protein